MEGDTPQAVISFGMRFEQEHKYTEAAEVYRKALERFPRDPLIFQGLRRVYEALRGEIEQNMGAKLERARQLWQRLKEYDQVLQPGFQRPIPVIIAPTTPAPLHGGHGYPAGPPSYTPPSVYASGQQTVPHAPPQSHPHHAMGGGHPMMPTEPPPRCGRDEVIAAHNAQFATRARTSPSAHSSKLFVAIPKSVTEYQVRMTFAWLPGYRGADVKVTNGVNQGYAFVQFATVREAVEAREYTDGLVLPGYSSRHIAVNFSTQPRMDLAMEPPNPSAGMAPPGSVGAATAVASPEVMAMAAASSAPSAPPPAAAAAHEPAPAAAAEHAAAAAATAAGGDGGAAHEAEAAK